MPKNTFPLGANLARLLCAALVLALIAACVPESPGGRKAAPQDTDQNTSPIAASQPVSSVEALIAFWPDPAQPIDRAIGFDFGARIMFNTPIDAIAHIAAFALHPGETPSDCLTPQIPTDRAFWAEQKDFAPGQHYYSRSFYYDDTPDTDRLVIRASVIETGPIGQVLYCEQKIYALTSGIARAPKPVQLPDPSALRSPDGRYFATADIYGGIVGEVNSQRVFTASMANGVEAWRWTNNSRFVIFRWRHPHNNSYTYVFDTQDWQLIWSTQGCKFIGRADLLMWETCGDYPVALSPNTPRFLMMNGKLIDLPDLRQVDLLPDFRVGQVSVLGESPNGELSAWSPDGTALAFVVQISFDPPGFALYSARGDGAQVRQVTSLANYPKSLQWSPDSQQVIVTTGPFDPDVIALRYVLDVRTGQLQVEQVTALTPTPPVPPTVSPALATWSAPTPSMMAPTLAPPPTRPPATIGMKKMP